MGWCSGTEVFDSVASALLDEEGKDVEEVLSQLYIVLRDKDWDCVNESAYYEHPIVRGIIEKLEPDWYDDED